MGTVPRSSFRFASGDAGKKRISVALALRSGDICSGDCPEGCAGFPTVTGERALFDCTACGGRDPKCKQCRDGRWELTGCPYTFAGRDVFAVIDLADEHNVGRMPLPGGTLAQMQMFLDAARFVKNERAEREYRKLKNVRHES